MIVDPEAVRTHMRELQAKLPKDRIFAERLKEAVTFISKNRHYYLHFGPYWWVFKDIVRRRVGGPKMVAWAGDADDGDMRSRYQTGDDFYDLCAAWLYQADHSGNLVDAPQRHNVVDDSGEDTQSYELNDPDMHR